MKVLWRYKMLRSCRDLPRTLFRRSLRPGSLVGGCLLMVGLGLVGLTVTPPLCAQEPPAGQEETATDGERAPDSTFFESYDVQVVNVDVFVSDRQGKAVEGLDVSDFELRVDGRPTPISNFYAVGARPGTRTGDPVAEPVDPEPISENRSSLGQVLEPLEASPDEQRLHVIVYFDNLFLQASNRNKVTRQVRTFLSEYLSAEDQVMVVTFERSLHVRQPFTNDLRAVNDQLFEIEELSGFAAQAEATRQRTLRNLERSNTFEEAEPWVDFYAKEAFNDLNGSIDGLKEMITTLAGLPGRKALLYVSDGLPMRAGADLFAYLDQRFTHGASGALLANRYSARSRFRQLIDNANSHRVSFYTLEAVGVRSHASVSAETRGSGGSQIEVDIERDFNSQETLQMLAADTGGRAAFNTNNIRGALERMGSDFRSYYSLGFVPVHGGDGRSHTIEVRVADRGLRIRHRNSYREKSAEARLLDQVGASLHHGFETHGLGGALELGDATAHERGNLLVPVTVSLPFSRVTLLPRGEELVGSLRLVVAVIDEDGKTSTPKVETLPLNIPRAVIDEVLGQEILYTAEVLVRRGPHDVAVALRDELSGLISVLKQPVRPPR